jgi:predicted transcriptional regulator
MAMGQELLNILLANDARADLLTVFRKNPGLIDSVDGVARRIGRNPAQIQGDVEELINLGVLRRRKLGSCEVIFLDRAKDKEVQNNVGEFLQGLKPNLESKV